jgi:hypothetical protein
LNAEAGSWQSGSFCQFTTTIAFGVSIRLFMFLCFRCYAALAVVAERHNSESWDAHRGVSKTKPEK